LADFRERNESELQRLSDEKLVEYAVAARGAGAADAERLALEHLAYGLLPFVQAQVAKSVPIADVEDVAGEALTAAIKSLHTAAAAFRGSTLAEFRGWLKRIAQFQVVEYWRGRKRQLDTQPLPSEHEREEEVFGEEPAADDFTDATAFQDVVDRLLDELDPPKRCVVELKVFERYSAAETADMVNAEFPDLNPRMTDANADQIASRFRKELRRKLDEG
jgi:RNA polymerase sigma factor (sigma-70 family)